ncbi:amino acid permease [Mycena amicta]|nr:amino acid permease [Mycena amicta]
MDTPTHSEKPKSDAKPEAQHVETADQSTTDVESGPPGSEGYKRQHQLVRQLKNRHVAMISIGANALRFGGPVGLLLGYVAVGTITYSVMISLGEMISYLPIPGGHLTLARRFVDPAFSFTMGWNYWYNWNDDCFTSRGNYQRDVILAHQLTFLWISAGSILIDFWSGSHVSNAVWITIIMVVIIGINMCGAGVYGEAEFIFASIKVITITGLIILGIVLDLGGGPNHDRIGFRYWKNPGEAKNPRRNLPKAIKRVYIRILLFYIGGVIIIGLLVPSNEARLNLADGTAASSPFVIAIERAGIKALPSIINACLLTSAWSAGSSDLFTNGLAAAGNAPRIFLTTLPNGLPIVALAFCSCFACLAYMAIGTGSARVFGYFSAMTSIAGLLTWFGICVTYIRFHAGMAAQGYNRKDLPFSSPLQPWAAWYALIFCVLICFFNGWATFLKGNFSAATLITDYLRKFWPSALVFSLVKPFEAFVLFPILYLGSKIYYWRRGHGFAWRPVEELDFVTDIDQIEADS